jgi:hypothetical protein
MNNINIPIAAIKPAVALLNNTNMKKVPGIIIKAANR